ncbi:MAG: aspartyl protease family protein [Dehalococcoidia bacterium]
MSVTVEVGSPDRTQFREVQLLVDTGATFSWLPRSLLQELGHFPTTRKAFEIGDGRVVERDVGEAPVRIGSEVFTTVCVFADSGEQPALGAVTLEQFLLAPDPVHQRLVPVTGLRVGRLSQ